jgi:hypothetical protein
MRPEACQRPAVREGGSRLRLSEFCLFVQCSKMSSMPEEGDELRVPLAGGWGKNGAVRSPDYAIQCHLWLGSTG